jgi:hypothetical protein
MSHAHVVILTAITLEYRAALQVNTGAWEGSRWEESKGPNGLPVAFRTFRGKKVDGGPANGGPVPAAQRGLGDLA